MLLSCGYKDYVRFIHVYRTLKDYTTHYFKAIVLTNTCVEESELHSLLVSVYAELQSLSLWG